MLCRVVVCFGFVLFRVGVVCFYSLFDVVYLCVLCWAVVLFCYVCFLCVCYMILTRVPFLYVLCFCLSVLWFVFVVGLCF